MCYPLLVLLLATHVVTIGVALGDPVPVGRLATALALPPSMGMPVLLGVTVDAVLAPVVDSYLAWRREQK